MSSPDLDLRKIAGLQCEQWHRLAFHTTHLHYLDQEVYSMANSYNGQYYPAPPPQGQAPPQAPYDRRPSEVDEDYPTSHTNPYRHNAGYYANQMGGPTDGGGWRIRMRLPWPA